MEQKLDLTNLEKTKSSVLTNDILQPGQSYSKMYGTEPRYNEILVITSTIQKPRRKMYLDITNKCQHATEKMNAK